MRTLSKVSSRAIILLLPLTLCACSREEPSSSQTSAVVSSSQVSSEQMAAAVSQPSFSEDQSLTAVDFVYLWMKKLDDTPGSENETFAQAKEKGLIPQNAAADTPLTVEQAAWLLCGSESAKPVDITHYNWQVKDIGKAETIYQGALLTAYAQGLILAQGGDIDPSEEVRLNAAQSILSRLEDPQRSRPPDCLPPYFEYQGLTEVQRLDPTILVDLKYATTDNFTGVVHYPIPLCLLEADTAKRLVTANAAFRKQGLTVKIWDGYRPVSVQWSLYNAAPADKKQYAPAPSKTSQHSKGIAVDLTLVDLKTGNELKMPTGFDDFTLRAHADYSPLPSDELAHRQELRAGMEAQGFTVYSLEWWHFYNPAKTSLSISTVELKDFSEKQNQFDSQYIKEHTK